MLANGALDRFGVKLPASKASDAPFVGIGAATLAMS
jgi:hypothetical protein